VAVSCFSWFFPFSLETTLLVAIPGWFLYLYGSFGL
jgi:hypothetical protein